MPKRFKLGTALLGGWSSGLPKSRSGAAATSRRAAPTPLCRLWAATPPAPSTARPLCARRAKPAGEGKLGLRSVWFEDGFIDGSFEVTIYCYPTYPKGQGEESLQP